MANLTGLSTNFFPTPKEGFTTTTSSSISSGAATVPLNSTTGYTNGDVSAWAIDPADAAKKQVFTGTVNTSSNQIENVVWTEGTNQSHAAGATVVDYVTATHMAMVTKGLTQQHGQGGAHTNITATGLTISSVTWASLVTGWQQTGESWAYASWTAGTATGTITVPTDATTKYSAGMRIRISQTTGGTKYGIITKVEATTLTVYFGTDYTLNNEAISSPVYSVHKAPFGFPLDPAKWTQTHAIVGGSVTSGTGAQIASDQLTVPIGSWKLMFGCGLQIVANGGNTAELIVGLSTATSSHSDVDLKGRIQNVQISGLTGSHEAPIHKEKTITVTAETIYYLVGVRNGASLTCAVVAEGNYISAVCALL